MKYLLAFTFLAVVCAIPRPEQTSIKGELEQWEPSRGPDDGDYEVIAAKGASPSKQYETTDESDEEDDDYDKDGSDLNLDSLINVLSSIREAIKKIIRDKLNHNKNGKVPVNEGTESGGPSSDLNDLSQSAVISGNDTASDNEPRVNITLIKKEIRDKIENITSKILRRWLGNNIVEEERDEEGENSNAVNLPEHINNTVPAQISRNKIRCNDTSSDDNVGTHETTVENGSETIKDIATEAPESENNTEPPQNDISSKGTEIISLSNGEVQINSTSTSGSKKDVNYEISTIHAAVTHSELITNEVLQGFKANDVVYPQSQVRFVNSYTRDIVQRQPHLQNLRNFPLAGHY